MVVQFCRNKLSECICLYIKILCIFGKDEKLTYYLNYEIMNPKYFSGLILIIVAFLSLFSSCEISPLPDIEPDPLYHIAGITNWTGHDPEICDPGRKLIFAITFHNKTKEYELEPDRSTACHWEGIEEGDVMKVVVMDENRDMIHTRIKNYTPSNPERPSLALNKLPYIQVCRMNDLELRGF